MIAEFITALPAIISLLERETVSTTPQVTPPSPITDALLPTPITVETPVVTPVVTPLPDLTGIPIIPIAELPKGEWYKPIEFDPWWLKENGYKGL